MSSRDARDHAAKPRRRRSSGRPAGVRGPARRTGKKRAPDSGRADRELGMEVRALRERSQDLEQDRAHYSDLFDFAPVTYALLDHAGVVMKVNLAGCRLLSVERARLIGRPLLPFVASQDRREFLEHLRLCRTRAGVVESEIRLVSMADAITCRLYSRHASYGGRDVYPTVIVDQSERLALDEARVAAERRSAAAEQESQVAHAASAAKDRFLAVVSHELRTPLTPALVAANRLAASDGLSDQTRRLAGIIERNIEVEARLIDDLLDVARIDGGRVPLDLEAVDAHDVLREAVTICEPFGDAKDVSIDLHPLASAHHVRADRARLRQVFWNLLNNAIKFSPPGSRILVRSANGADASLRVVVRDHGAGMDPPVLQRLFAPFDRLRLDRESRGGLGLGLTICKGIIGAHGGQLWASSDGRGMGSTFAVELATIETAEPAEAEIESGPDVAAGEQREAWLPLRILLVEDDRDSSEILSLFLSQYGCVVEVAASCRAALERLDERWDVVLSDIGLPDGSGLDVARRARRLPQPPRRLIALTGYGARDDIRASRDAGFDEHVVKPIDFDRLLAALSLRSPSEPRYR